MRPLLILIAISLWFSMVPSAQRQAAAVDAAAEADRMAIRAVIADQIDAFRSGDAVRAFAHAAPAIQRRFGDPQNFVRMVRAAFRPVYRPQSVRFAALDGVGDSPVQRVEVIGPDGLVYQAAYAMMRDARGRWRISACVLRSLPGLPA